MKSSIKTVNVACNSCNANDTEFVTYGVEHEYDNTTDDIFTVVRCRQCGLLYLNPRPDVSELPTIYPQQYYAYHLQQQNKEAENKTSILYKARKHVYVSRLTRALDLCPPAQALKVLDIGCADGRALNWYAQVQKFKVETYGVDFDETAVARAREAGHHVYQGRFEEADIPNEFFDMVVATHVIEHVADPTAFARRAFEVLKPGGIFLCETPNTDTLDARMFKDKHWGGYHFPRHWVFYDPKSLATMASAVGFEVVRVDFHPAPAFWNWTFHSLAKDWSKSKSPLIKPFARQLADLADFLFPPVDFQKNTFKNFLAVSLFTSIDIAIKAVTGRTANMAAVLRRPVAS